MRTFTMTLTITEDGAKLPGFPIVKTINVTESKGYQKINRISAAGFTELPLEDLGNINVLLFSADQDTDFQLNDRPSGSVPVNASGLVLLWNCAIPSSASQKAALQNNSGSVAAVEVLSGGS